MREQPEEVRIDIVTNARMHCLAVHDDLMRQGAPSFIADFDSATGLTRAISNYLHGRDYPALGKSPALAPLARAANFLPQILRERVFALGGATEAVGVGKLGKIDPEEISRWVVGRYPARQYRAIGIGSSNGAMAHLCAAFDMPWLGQTFFIPIRHLAGHPDYPRKAMEFGRKHAHLLLDRYPHLQLHHAHDGNQDRLMLQYIDHFRIKRRELGPAYEAFLRERLEPGGTIVVVDCQRKWPTTRVGERHVFQHGALGGATEEEFRQGSARVEEYLERYDAPVRKWDAPEPDEKSPEAEWGFEPALLEDIRSFAKRHGFTVKRLVFDEPDDLSPLVADFYREWYRQRGISTSRLLVESFNLVEPYWTLRTGSVPYWMVFNMGDSADSLQQYLDAGEPWDEISIMLFNHGVEGVGFADIRRWRTLLRRATVKGRFIGVNEKLFPRDFGAFGAYNRDVRSLRPLHPLPDPIDIDRLGCFLADRPRQYAVKLIDG